MKKLTVGLNGFGRIGRAFARIALTRGTFDIALINTRKTPTHLLAYLLQYDSIYRKFERTVVAREQAIEVDDVVVATSQVDSPEEIPWAQHNVDVVVDATGAFMTTADLQKHIGGGSVKTVILTAPAKDEMPHCVLGVNDASINFRKVQVISNASCTTNSAAPLIKVLHDTFGVEHAMLTTVHAYTSTQSLLDDANKNETRSRAADLSIIPTTTGAAEAVVRVIPELKGRIDGMSLRVPVPIVSFTDVTAQLKRSTTVEEVNAAFKAAADGSMKGLMAYETTPLVSSDYIGNPHSSIFDANYTKVVNERLVKVTGWYDNEWGYSSRLVDLVERFA
ncbi:type I glyceraldehyde-3-phosphate dehydrogenase [Candidatus Roizmanbacteria bacterium CG10_big_fil_rev_8_21_14_0_10_45_7]|uniref:Type I glyceraldehyde-3-phosphate dehydrogenase n=1 Tax=Candidatus Roizmanbacteria bacterium CG10_big_fil_rev_8_21_14_0_10_45_7 TaxID=1974854 RepID=A0A2M8KUH4_9BACT|nr:MAG: type I glyceraldehyde-3-phosphate dehydrogenase [Candidatus Roizmanbacteria bacterium CG10_big_fil_rev_8_21_14_0_10_45_7]